MSRLEPPDTHFLSAAEGWLMLGDFQSAGQELDHVSPAQQSHPLVLDLRWQVHLKAKRFPDCLEVAKDLIHLAPDQPMAWAKYAQSFYYLGRYQEAYEASRGSLEQFPQAFALHYDFACYACLLGHLDEAKAHLTQACALRDRESVKAMALEDKDLVALRPEIERL